MVTTRRGAKAKVKAKATEPTKDVASPIYPVELDDHDGRGSSDPMQINSPHPNVDVHSPPNSPMMIDPATQFTDQETPTSPKDDYAEEDEDEDKDVNENENSSPNSPMHLDPPSDLEDIDNPDSETHENIAPKGDLIIQFSDTTTVRVSSTTLSQASAPLETTIKKWRSTHIVTAIPMTQEMHEDDAYTLYRLLRLLHNRPDPGTAEHRMFDIQGANLLAAVKDGAGHLHQLAILVDKYQCQEAFAMTAESLLSEFAFPSARDAMGLNQAVQLVTAAYLLNQPRHFQLFTKRLVTYYAVDWTKEGPDGFSKDFSPEIPTKQATLMKTELYRQSRHANSELSGGIQSYSFGRCFKHIDKKCDEPRSKDLMIVRRITESINVPGKQWPAHWCNRVTLRYILPRLYRLERVQHWLRCAHHREQTHDSVGPEQFTQLCERVDREVLRGLCLGCTKAGRVCECDAGSAPHAGALRFVDQDSFLFPTSWLGKVDQSGGYR
jgi:hypothetical protein